ncbi:MAG: ABC transporter permease [Microbacterium sp.]
MTTRSRSSLMTPLFWLSGTVLALVIVAVTIGPMLLVDPYTQSLTERLLPPFSEGHILGTDSLGRDLASRLVNGGRIAMVVSLFGMLGSMLIGIVAGLLASSSNRTVRWALERLIDVQMALPYVILAIVLVSATGTSLGILILLMVLAGWASAARIVRSVAMAERAKDYVPAAEMVGAGVPRVLFKYIGPAVFPVALTIAPLQASAMIVMESTLSFLGLGIQPPTASWGGILLEGKPYLDEAWWLTTLPGIAIAITSAALLGLGSALEIALARRQRQRTTAPIGAAPAESTVVVRVLAEQGMASSRGGGRS